MRWIWAALALALAGCGGSKRPTSRRRRTPTATPTPKTTAAAVAARSHVPVLCYHQIRTPTSADSAADRPYIVSPSVLDDADAGARRGGLHADHAATDYVAHMARGASVAAQADPADLRRRLRRPVHAARCRSSSKHHFVATFFVMTVVLGKPGWLTQGPGQGARPRRDDDRRPHLRPQGGAGVHGATTTRRSSTTPGRELRNIVGHKVELFAYPFGSYSSDAIQPMFSAGYRAAFQLADKLDSEHPLWSIRRIIVPELDGQAAPARDPASDLSRGRSRTE